MVHGFTSVLICGFSFCALIAVVILMRRISGTFRVFLISNFFMLTYIVLVFVGAVGLNMFYFKPELVRGFYERPDLLLNIWYYAVAGLFLVPIGMFFANLAFGYHAEKETGALLAQDVYIGGSDRSIIIYAVVAALFLFSLGVFGLYLAKVPRLPIIGMIRGMETEELARLRSASGNAFQGKYWVYSLFMKELPQLLLLITFFMRKSFKWKALFLLLLGYTALTAVAGLHKAPIVYLFLLLLFAYFYEKKRIRKSQVLLIMAFGFLIVVLMYLYFMGMKGRSFSRVISAISHRVFIGQVSDFFWYQLYAENEGLLLGRSFPNPMGLFGYKPISITVEISRFSLPLIAQSGIVGSAPTAFFGEWYVNFGGGAALASMFFIGFIVQSIEVFFVSTLARRKFVLFSALFIYFIVYFCRLVGSSFVGIWLDEKLFLPVIVICAVIVIKGILRKISENTSYAV